MNPDSEPPTPRAVRPDAETADSVILVKNVASLRATYQVRTLAFLAGARGKQLALMVPAGCRFAPDLEDLIRAAPRLIRRENLP